MKIKLLKRLRKNANKNIHIHQIDVNIYAVKVNGVSYGFWSKKVALVHCAHMQKEYINNYVQQHKGYIL